MTDFQGQDPKNGSVDFDNAELLQGLPNSPNVAPTVTVAVGPGNVVTLPADAVIDRVFADGRDLVIILADGRQIVVPDGAIILPQLVVGETAVPPANLAALLLGNEPEPAAGAPQSSGGDFATDPGDIQAAFDIGNLLPYTELSRPLVEEREIIPAAKDEEPQIDIEVDDSGVSVINAEDVVDEEGLPARGSEPAGTQAASNAEATFGFINFAALDGVGAVAINGVAITTVGQVFTSALGRLVITSIAPGRIGYDYVLTDNTITAQADLFTVAITDTDGDTATATLRIGIVDDGPIGVNDSAIVPAGSQAPISGNVLTNDISGADNFPVGGGVTTFGRGATSVAAGGTVQGQYGTLTINANGTYTYDRGPNTPGGVSETFTYAIVDQDGSTASATLTITIADSPAVITFVPGLGDGTVVLEPQLPDRGTEPAGSAFDGDTETTSGTITFTSPDGVASVSVGGTTITPGALPQQVSSDATGTLVVTGYTYNPATGVGSITYTYTLADNTLDTNGTTLVFPITVTDLDGDSASDTLDITIIDDMPLAVNDSGDQASENASVTVNVIGNDTIGADGVSLATGVALVPGSLTGTGTLVNNGNGTFTYAPGPGEQGELQFQYSITDGDGDVSTATVLIRLLPDSTPEIAIRGDNSVEEAGLPARGSEAPGSDETANSETATGTIPLSTGGDSIGSLVIGGVNVTAGGTVNGLYGVLTITVSGGAYSYSYTLADNTSGDATSESFAVVLTDSDGDVANANLAIAIVDDQPTALADTDSLASGTYGPATGNVLTDASAGDAGDADTGADSLGADGGAVTA
ncbi:MAG: Ig-like domain-containing protein, partial [Alteraurantiacibacter sp.]